MMQYLLSRASQSILTQMAREQTLCAFDFDGTLSPMVEHPHRARVRARTLGLLERLAALYPCVIVSGRARADLLGRLSGVKVERVIGNHGAETELTTSKSRRLIKQWRTTLEVTLSSLAGLWVEDKGLSLAVHYRQSPRKTEARRRILEVARSLKHARVFGGKQVVNLALDGALNKGEAVAAERDRLGCDWVLYVGDDENDEDAFALDGNVVPVRIGRKALSHADYYLRTQTEIDALLELLCCLRTGGSR